MRVLSSQRAFTQEQTGRHPHRDGSDAVNPVRGAGRTVIAQDYHQVSDGNERDRQHRPAQRPAVPGQQKCEDDQSGRDVADALDGEECSAVVPGPGREAEVGRGRLGVSR